MPEWLMGADCKSADFRLRWFKSSSAQKMVALASGQGVRPRVLRLAAVTLFSCPAKPISRCSEQKAYADSVTPLASSLHVGAKIVARRRLHQSGSMQEVCLWSGAWLSPCGGLCPP